MHPKPEASPTNICFIKKCQMKKYARADETKSDAGGVKQNLPAFLGGNRWICKQEPNNGSRLRSLF